MNKAQLFQDILLIYFIVGSVRITHSLSFCFFIIICSSAFENEIIPICLLHFL